jgi:hypothetical protein
MPGSIPGAEAGKIFLNTIQHEHQFLQFIPSFLVAV